jgi:hypothetical protein
VRAAKKYRSRVFIRCVLPLLVTANAVSISPIFITLMMEAIRSFETSVPTKSTRYNIPEDGILHEEWCLLGCYAVWLL